MEHRVSGAPEQQGRTTVVVEHGRALLQGGVRRIGRGDRDVGHEVPDRLAAGRPDVGGTQRVPVLAVRHASSSGHEGRCPPAAQIDQAPGCGDQRRHSHVVGFGHRGVGEDQSVDVEGAGRTHCHRAAPVVSGEHHGPVHFLAAEGDQFDHPIGQAPRPPAFGPTHAGLVDGDHPPLGFEGGEQVLPDVTPRRVSVDAYHGAGRAGPGVQDVPVDRPSVRSGERHPAGPGRVEAPGGQLAGARSGPGRRRWTGTGPGRGHGPYQVSSAAATFSPEPMPMSRTRSPGAMSSATVDRV